MKLRLSVSIWLLLLLITPVTAAPRQAMHGHVPAMVARLQPLGNFAGTNQLNLAIGLPLRNRAALTNLLQQIYDPASPKYHHYLTPDQFTRMFGPTEKDYAAVVAFAKANGLRVTGTHPNRMLVDVKGSVANIEKAMHVTMRLYQHPNEARRFHAPDVEPSLDLSVPVLSIGGLDDYSLPSPRLVATPLVSRQKVAVAPNAGSGPSGSYLGNDFRAAYAPGVTLTGSGQTVGLLQFDGYSASDITYYESQAGLPSVTLSNVLINGASGHPSGSGGEVEVSLDIETAISMAPGLARVIVYMAPNPSPWEDILNRMATDNLAKQLSCSWYQPGGAAMPTADQIFQQMAAQGQSFFNASGDFDAYTGLIDFPGDTPYLTQVGGTTLSTTGPGGPRTSETVWNRGNGIGSGGGISTQYPIPSWQANVSMTINQGSTIKRNTPDVALTAENVYVRANNSDYRVGGTSCAAPLWAGYTALINQQGLSNGGASVGFITPAIYSIGLGANYASAFYDITTGNNTRPGSPTRFFGVTGYDLCTGWGTPAGQGLIDALVGPPVPTPPTIITQPQSQTNVSGSSAIFNVVAAGSFPLSYQWALNGTNITGATNATLLLANVQPTNAGSYAVTVTNLYGSKVSSNAVLTVLTLPPTIVTQPSNQAVYVGFTAGFSVAAAGSLPLTYQWSFNGTNLVGATNTTLTLANVQFSQAGNYAVLVTNLYGLVLSSNAVLSVNPPPPCAPAPSGIISWWSAEGSASDIAGGNNGTLLNGTGFAAGEVGQAFNFNGADQCVQIPYSPSLITSNYTFEAWINPLGQPTGIDNQAFIYGETYSFGQLVVRVGTTGVRPVFQFGNGAAFYDVVSTNEIPMGQFSHVVGTWDGTTLRLYINGVLNNQNVPGASPVASGCEFFIGGTYHPTADGCQTVGQFFTGLIDEVSCYNRALSLTEIQTIYVTGPGGKCPIPPSITSQPANKTVVIGSTATFTVGAGGTVPLRYQWNFGGTNIIGATNTTLTLTNVQFSQSGNYAVLVTNLYGSVLSSNAVLTVVPSGTCVPAPSGIISWWSAEGSASDITGGNNGTLLNGTGFATGEVGQAFNFNGVNQCVQIPYSPSLITSSYTFEAWIDPLGQPSGIDNQAFIYGETYSFGQLVVRVGTTGVRPVFQFGNGGAFYDVVSTNEIPMGQFSHVVGTWDGTTLRLYINGVLNNQNVPGASPVASGCEFFIGGTYHPTADGCQTVGQFFTGLIDEVSCYNRALSLTEIQSIYNAGSAGKCSSISSPVIISQPTNRTVNVGGTATFTVGAGGFAPLSFQWSFGGTNLVGATNTTLTLTNVQLSQAGNYAVLVTNLYGSVLSSNAVLTVVPPGSCVPVPAGLISWWAAEGSASDIVGGNNGTLLNGTGFAAGEVGQAFNFNGTNQCVQIPYSPSLITSNYTFEVWLDPLGQPTGIENQAFIYGETYSFGQLVVRTGITGVIVAFQFGNGGAFYGVVSTNEIPMGQFSHVVGTWDGTTLRLYINGVLNNQNVPGASPAASGCEFFIGGTYHPTADGCETVGQFFKGLIDEVSCYNRALSLTEIQSIYNAGSAGKCSSGSPPVIILQPTNRTVNVGGTATFTVGAGGIPPLSFQWSFGGTNLIGATNLTLTLTNVQLSQAGNYAVLVTNLYGSVLSSNAVLTVSGLPPGITTQPANQTVNVGGTATFTVGAGGTAPLSFQWSFGGTNLIGATNLTLTLTNVQLSQAGNYAVLVTNLYGSTFSSNAVLTVNPPPPCVPASLGLIHWWPGEGNANDVIGGNNGTLLNGPVFTNGEVGQAFSFSGGADGVSNPCVQIPYASSLAVSNYTVEVWINPLSQVNNGANQSWIFGESQGVAQLVVRKGTTGVKVVFQFKNSLGGFPGLISTNEIPIGQFSHVAGTWDGTTLRLYINGVFNNQSAPGSIPAVSGCEFFVGGTYHPATGGCQTVGQFFNGLIDELSYYNRALTLSEIQSIYNGGGGGKCIPTLPVILVQPASQTVAAGKTAGFNVTASGSIPLSYQWNFSGTNIPGATNASLTLTNVQVNQAGNYAVLVTNLYGSVLSSNAVLTVTLDHFAWNPIPSPRFAHTPFTVVIRAQDTTNGLFTNFNGTALLSATNFGITVTPPVSGNFVQGAWTGLVSISQTASNVILRANDGLGHFGLANPFTVVNLPNLGIMRSGNIALFTWPTGYSGFVLETSDSLSPGAWVVVPYAPIQFGSEYLLPLDMTGTNGFYRLRFPGP